MRRFFRVPANWISIIFFPLIQLLVFSQLYKDIVQLPAFGDGQLPRLPRAGTGRLRLVPGGGLGGVRHAGGVPERLPGQAARHAHRAAAILAGEMVPLFFQAAIMAGCCSA